MKQQNSPKPAWTKPELVRLGTIRDIAGPPGGNRQSSAIGHS
ncbi:hypothetical protein [Qipengyuania gaetbuli]|nr:hypothetical protein [Qipengyuania gaetbuli]